MKKTLILLTLISFSDNLFSQKSISGDSAPALKVLTFDKRFVETEDKWVAVKTDKDSIFNLGFVYIDAAAGLTLNYEGTFTVAKDGTFNPKKLDSFGVKYRLQPNNVHVAVIPAAKYDELKIKEIPDWLSTYKSDTSSVAHLYRWGFLYNSYDECAKALTYLERARKINPKFKGLEVELAFSYNCLNQYDSAIAVLKNAIESNPSDCYFYKELVYSQTQMGQLNNAAKTCEDALPRCTNDGFKGEMCYNLTHEFYLRKDKENFKYWAEKAKKWNTANPSLMSSIKTMEEDIAK